MLVGREAPQSLQPPGMVVGADEQLQMCPKLSPGLVVVALCRRSDALSTSLYYATGRLRRAGVAVENLAPGASLAA